ncbi:MAG: type II secretion system F family protein [Sedimentisphaerales bacterium]|nr:type II secretion system F family protein [Sedimentisphaerales bacterium]
MEIYKYIARDVAGSRKEGIRQATSHLEVLVWLREQGITPISVHKVKGGGKERGRGRGRVNSSELSNLCWQLTTMIEGGVPITSAINTIGEDCDNATMRNTLGQICDRMQKGETFSDAIADYPKVFNQLFCAMINAGERGGMLPTALNRLAHYFDNRDKLIRKVKTAMAYPIFVLCFISFIVIMIMTFIIPRFRVIFKQIGSDLPIFTKIYMGVYDFILAYLPFILIGLGGLIFALITYSKTKAGHERMSKLTLRIPLIGKIISQAFVATFCRTLSTLLSSGVPILEALNILSGMSKNDVIRAAVLRTREHIVEGASISIAMAACGFFPNLTVKMTQVGEESGSLPSVLDRTADYYERRIDSLLTTLTGVMEPALIIVVGAIVLVTVLALYLPIFNISDMKK